MVEDNKYAWIRAYLKMKDERNIAGMLSVIRDHFENQTTRQLLHYITVGKRMGSYEEVQMFEECLQLHYQQVPNFTQILNWNTQRYFMELDPVNHWHIKAGLHAYIFRIKNYGGGI